MHVYVCLVCLGEFSELVFYEDAACMHRWVMAYMCELCARRTKRGAPQSLRRPLLHMVLISKRNPRLEERHV